MGRDPPLGPRTPRELATMCDVVMTALPAPPHVKQVLTGEDGVLAGLRSGGVWIDHSTTDYQQTLELAEMLTSIFTVQLNFKYACFSRMLCILELRKLLQRVVLSSLSHLDCSKTSHYCVT